MSWSIPQVGVLFKLAESGDLAGDELVQAAQHSPLRPSRRHWLLATDRLLEFAGAALLASALIFFFAWNWPELHGFAKLRLALTALSAYAVLMTAAATAGWLTRERWTARPWGGQLAAGVHAATLGALVSATRAALRWCSSAIEQALLEVHDEARAAGRALPCYALVRLDADGRANLAELGDDLPAPGGELLVLRIRTRDGRPAIGPNAFFFHEGEAGRFEAASWGEFHVDTRGHALLTHLRDAELRRLGEIER